MFVDFLFLKKKVIGSEESDAKRVMMKMMKMMMKMKMMIQLI